MAAHYVFGMNQIQPMGFFIIVLGGVMAANIIMFLTNRAVERYRRSGSIFWLYTAGMLIALCALIVIAPMLTIAPPG